MSSIEKLRENPTDLIDYLGNQFQGALSSTNPILRCAAGEALGRIAQVVGDSRFIADMAQYSFNRLGYCQCICKMAWETFT